VRYSGVEAEAIAVDYLYSILPHLGPVRVPWLTRLVNSAREQEIVLRALGMSREDYAEHLGLIRDWRYHRELRNLCRLIRNNLPEKVWVVEVSLPELFPANRRKLGEIVLDATRDPSPDLDYTTYVFARLPGRYVLVRGIGSDNKPDFVSVASGLVSHTPVYAVE
jgi:hypothetical protein